MTRRRHVKTVTNILKRSALKKVLTVVRAEESFSTAVLFADGRARWCKKWTGGTRELFSRNLKPVAALRLISGIDFDSISTLQSWRNFKERPEICRSEKMKWNKEIGKYLYCGGYFRIESKRGKRERMYLHYVKNWVEYEDVIYHRLFISWAYDVELTVAWTSSESQKHYHRNNWQWISLSAVNSFIEKYGSPFTSYDS